MLYVQAQRKTNIIRLSCAGMTNIREFVSLISLCILLVCSHASPSSATTLKFLLMVANDSSPDSSAVVPAVEQTLEEINKDTSILPGHHLDYILRDTQVYLSNIFLDSNFFTTHNIIHGTYSLIFYTHSAIRERHSMLSLM